MYEKLKAIGLDDKSVKWFHSYLSDRRQFVSVNTSHSQYGNIDCGVPQGSILGPLLFSIYVNDMVQSVNCDLYMYADDAALVISGKSVDQIEMSLSNEMESLSIWLEQNKLSLHLGKTESILFATHKKLSVRNSLNIQCKGVYIAPKSCIKYLGAYFDQDMSFSTIGRNYISKINGKLKFLYRKVSFLDERNKKLLCTSLLQSHFDYACNLWYRSVHANIKHNFQTAQNKVIRYILSYENRKHLTFDDFKKLNMLDVERRVEYIMSSF